MKEYFLIQNDGEVDVNSFELIGASTKRNDDNKIGFFGSGLKYSIAYMFRKGIDFKVFSGTKELKFSLQSVKLREQTFERICIDNNPTSYTTTMGATWTEDWFVIREIYCNAIDESSCIINKNPLTISGQQDKTCIFIEKTENIQKILDNWNEYFCFDRTPLFYKECLYTSCVGSNDINGKCNQTVVVYNKMSSENGSIFRKGIRVESKKELMFDYNLEYAEINEDRTLKSLGYFDYVLVNLMAEFCNENYVKTILKSINEYQKNTQREWYAISGNIYNSKASVKWVDFATKNTVIVHELSGRYTDEANATTKEIYYIPFYFAKQLKKDYPEIRILGLQKLIDNCGLDEIEPSEKISYLLKETLLALKEMKYEIPYHISICRFHEEYVLGYADRINRVIYISEKVFDKGKREIALTLIEETEHIVSGKGDKTRDFEYHLMSSWLKTMEEANAIFL